MSRRLQALIRPSSSPSRCVILRMMLLAGAVSIANADDPFWAMTRPALGSGHREPTVAVGVNRIVQVGNHWIAAYDRQGTQQWSARLHETADPDLSPYFWLEVDPDPNDEFLGGIDSRVLYDQFSKRFIVIRMKNGDATPSHLYLAVSKGFDIDQNDPVDPVGAWDKYLIETKVCETGCSDPWPNCAGCETSQVNFHFPGLAVTQQNIHVAALGGVAGQALGAHALHVFEKPPVGAPSNFYENFANYRSVNLLWDGGSDFPGLFPSLPMPAHFFGTMSRETMYLVQLFKRKDSADNQGKLRVIAVTDPLNTPAVSTKILTIDEIGWETSHVEELCPTDVNGWVKKSIGNIQNAVWRAGKLYFALEDSITDPDIEFNRMGIRWFEVDTNDWPAQPGNDPVIVQQGLLDGGRAFESFGPPGPSITPSFSFDRPVHYMYPYVMLTSSGDMALFFTRHTAHGYPELVWTARRNGDPPGKMHASLTVMQAGDAGVSVARLWGEYQGIALDPVGENRLWATGQLGRCPDPPCTSCGNGGVWHDDWHTSIGSYTVPQSPPRTVTLSRQTDLPTLPAFIVKTMPTDVNNEGYAILSGAAPTHTRLYGDDQLVTLQVSQAVTINVVIDHWEQDGNFLSTLPRIQITADADTTLVPVYVMSP